MKRIAISLGSLSLIITQQGHSDPMSSLDSPAITASETLATEINRDINDDIDPFAFSEMTIKELEDELLSLEKELELEQSSQSPQESDVAFREPMQELISLHSESAPDPFDLTSAATEELSPPLFIESYDNNQTQPSLSEAEDILDLNKPELMDPGLIVNNQIVEPAYLLADQSNELIDSESLVSGPVNEELVTKEIFKKSDTNGISISLSQVFAGSPSIYLALFGLSTISVALWLFNFFSLSKYAKTSPSTIKEIQNKLLSNQFDDAIAACNRKKCFFSKIMAAGVSSRKYGLQFMLESMKSEGKRVSVSFWQRLNIIHDIAIIAPMIGLLGTVLGMFYAFYDLNRSFESIGALFDGLGVSVGTTVAGIFVAILAMILHSASKYKLVKSLTFVENEAVALAHLIDSKNN